MEHRILNCSSIHATDEDNRRHTQLNAMDCTMNHQPYDTPAYEDIPGTIHCILACPQSKGLLGFVPFDRVREYVNLAVQRN
jgi:hypothetical protein